MARRSSRRRKNKDQTKTPLLGEIASAGSRELYESFTGDSIQNPDKVIQYRSNGLDLALYEEMENKDTHIASVIGTRKEAVIGKDWSVKPASDSPEDKRIAEFVEQVLSEIGFDQARLNQLDAMMKGFAVSEIMWEVSEGQYWISDFLHRKPWRFCFGKENELRFKTEGNSLDGEVIEESKFWVYTFDPRYCNRYGRGLGQVLFWPYWFKKNNIKFWALFNDKFGSPTVVGKFAPGAKKEDQEKLLNIIKSIQQETGVTIPSNVMLELMEASRRGDVDTYEKFVTWCENSQSKVVLGQTLTTQQGENGARSLGEVHKDVLDSKTKFDCDGLCESLNNGPIKQLVDFNYHNVKDYPKLWIGTEDETDLKAQSEIDSKVFQTGYRRTKQSITDTYGEGFEPRADSKPTPDSNPSAPPAPEFSEEADEDLLKGFADRILENVSLDEVIDPIKDLLENSESLEDFNASLLKLKDKLPSKQFQESLGNALVLADATGRFNALPEDEKEDA